jgi:transposase
VHPDTVRDALKRLEYSWTRPRRQLPSPADREEKMAQVRRRIAAAPEETTILFADETELKRFPPLRRMWQPVGEQRPVRVPDANDDFALYGALDVGSGQTFTRAFEKERSDYTIQFLELLKARTTGNVLLIWDRASWHTSGQVEAFLEKTSRFETHLLPPRSPQANPVEDLWRELQPAWSGLSAPSWPVAADTSTDSPGSRRSRLPGSVNVFTSTYLGTISKLGFIGFDGDLEFPEPPVPQKPARQLHYPQVNSVKLISNRFDPQVL